MGYILSVGRHEDIVEFSAARQDQEGEEEKRAGDRFA
jgi:hypothetical protein